MLCLYESQVDLGAVAAATYRKCQLAAGLSTLGFAGVLAGMAPTASPPVLALVAFGAVATNYKHLVLSRRMLASYAMRHVERLSLLPTAGAAANEGDSLPTDESIGIEQRLAATPELQCKLSTANFDLSIKLVDSVTAWEGARYSGFVADARTSFGDICQRPDILHLDSVSNRAQPGAPTSTDPALLAAVTATSKVIAEQQIECREDVESLLKIPSTDKQAVQNLLAKIESEKASGIIRSPKEECDMLGKQALFSGTIFLIAGGLFVGRLFAQGPDGDNRMRDPTLGELFMGKNTSRQ